MFFYEGLSCPVCKKALKPEEDIVACPHCGLPHHRACWEQEGRCHLEHLHGTEQQWSRDQAAEQPESAAEAPSMKRCPRCGAENPEFAEFCKRCGLQVRCSDWHSGPTSRSHQYTPFSSPKPDTCSEDEMIDDVSARDYAAIAGAKADYYLPRFRQIAEGKSGGWNWSAFLLAPYWLLYRKMYVAGTLMVLLQAANTFINSFVLSKLGITTTEQLYAAFSNPAESKQRMFYLLSMWILSVILLLMHVIIGYAGNRLYKNHCSALVRKARLQTPDITATELTSVGGVSFGVALIAYFILSFLTQCIELFFI